MPGGRPSKYTKDLAAEICERMAQGQSLRSVCRDPDMPDISTVFKWRREIDEFSQQYEKARADQIDCFASEITEIADDSTNDFYEKALANGEVAVVGNNEMVNRARLRVDARKWACERMMPKKYGPHSSVDVGGQEGNPLTVLKIE